MVDKRLLAIHVNLLTKLTEPANAETSFGNHVHRPGKVARITLCSTNISHSFIYCYSRIENYNDKKYGSMLA